MERRRRIAIGLGVLALVAAVAPKPSADIHIDLAAIEAPRVQAAVDLGLMGVTVLLTWGGEQLR